MALLKMKRISVYGLNTNRKAVLEQLHKSGIVEVFEPDCSKLGLAKKNVTKSINQFDGYMKSAKAALSILDEYMPHKTGFFFNSNRRILPLNYYSMKSAKSDEVLKKVHHIIKLSDNIKTNLDNIRKIEEKQIALGPFIKLDVPMKVTETENTKIVAGSLSGLWDEIEFNIELSSARIDNLYFEILEASKEQTMIWLIYPKCDDKKISTFLQKFGFIEPNFSLSHHLPKEKIEVLERAKNELKSEIDKLIEEIKSLDEYRNDIELFFDHLKLRKEKYDVLSKLGLTEHSFLLEGYIPEKYSKKLKSKLESEYEVYIELFDPEDESIAPKEFENNAFVSPVEGITETYSMPSVVDIDPNPIMSFFYYLFFGMMFSDAGYGLLVMLVCGYLGFSKRLEKIKRKTYRMFFYCGLSTTFWGLMYGSFFGSMINTVSVTFFNKDIALKPVWIDPVSEPLTLLIFSIALGLVQILVGMGIKFYMLWKQGKKIDAIYDVGFWMLVLTSIGIFAAGFALNISVVSTIGIVLTIIGALGLVFTQGRHSKNIVGKIFGGIISLYDITNYVSDALSYSRLMALGLATGVIANVVSILGSIAGSGIVGAISFILISIIGHAMNFAINMLGAYVHTNRLQYVEFFGKFYEGGGRKFNPFRMNTEYHLIGE